MGESSKFDVRYFGSGHGYSLFHGMYYVNITREDILSRTYPQYNRNIEYCMD